ncbi:MAG: hypothetical protein NTZ17_15600 [Phycisphaerae bacterium]|nr:hypothetical protein [Phycisphaerae bacterium]
MRIKALKTAVLIITGSLVAVASGTPMGSPTAYLGAGRWGFGAEYGYGQMDLETSGTVTDTFPGFSRDSWPQDFRIDNLKSNMAFGTVAYGLTDNWDLFARIGAADAKGTIVVLPAIVKSAERQDDSDGSFGLAWGVGTRATLHKSGPWSFGGLVQVTWFRPGDGEFSIEDPLPLDPVKHEPVWVGDAKLSYWQAQASLAAAFQVDTWRFWAGPFFQFTQGDMDFSGTYSLTGAVGTGTLNWASTIDDSFQVGGHFGANWEICDQFNLWGEGQITSDAWLIGVGLVFIPEKSFGI